METQENMLNKTITTTGKIIVRSYSLFYGKFQALRDVNIDIPSNQITSIIGPSGCGKSTFLRSFNRMNDLIPSVTTEGDIALDGKDIFQEDVVVLRKGGHGLSTSESLPKINL